MGMTPGIQTLLILVGCLLTALLSLLLSQVSGIRTDLKNYIAQQIEMNNRLIRLETKFHMAQDHQEAV